MILVYYLVFINIIAFGIYGLDKAKAKANQWRIPESTLLFLAVIGGAIGAWCGMQVFHHKTKKNRFRITVPILLVLELLLIVFCLYQNYHLVVTEYTYESDKVDEKLNGYRIVQISDLHNQFFGWKQKALLDRIAGCRPDLIVVTGDVVDSNHTNYKLALDFFEGAAELASVYYITGNHELWLEKDEFSDFLNDIGNLGIHFIDDSVAEVDGFSLIGIADSTLHGNLDYNAYSSLGEAHLKIMLAHEPAFHTFYQAAGMDLVLTGHVHGGQFIIPGKGGLVSPDFEFFPELYQGVHTYGDTTMVISRGLGNSIIPVRVYNYPEIVVVELKGK